MHGERDFFFFKKQARVIVGTGNCKSGWPAGWRPREEVRLGCGCEGSLEADILLPWETSVISLKISTYWRRHTYITEYNLFYPNSNDLIFITFKNHIYIHSNTNCNLTKKMSILALPSWHITLAIIGIFCSPRGFGNLGSTSQQQVPKPYSQGSPCLNRNTTYTKAKGCTGVLIFHTSTLLVVLNLACPSAVGGKAPVHSHTLLSFSCCMIDRSEFDLVPHQCSVVLWTCHPCLYLSLKLETVQQLCTPCTLPGTMLVNPMWPQLTHAWESQHPSSQPCEVLLRVSDPIQTLPLGMALKVPC